jgi:hypothetical protein
MARFLRGQGAPYADMLERALSLATTPDPNLWETFGSHLAPSLVVDDHRLAGVGRIEGASVEVLMKLSPDLIAEPAAFLALDRHGALMIARNCGHAADGGVFETLYVCLLGVEDGLFKHIEFFETGDLQAARDRFEELRPDPLRIPPNAVTRATDRALAAFEAKDWQSWTAELAPGMVITDHRTIVRVDMDRDEYLSSAQFLSASGVCIECTVEAVRGDRLALQHFSFRGEGGEADYLQLDEGDGLGVLVSGVIYDAGDRASAFAEMERRFVSGEAAACAAAQAPIVAFDRAFADRDWKVLRASLADDFVATDHRPAWMGSSDAGEYVASMRMFAELSPDVTSETMWLLAWGDHGRVAMTKVVGTQVDAGPFENVFVWMLATAEGEVQRIEVWEADEAHAAVARFEELRPSRGGKIDGE